MWGWEAGESGVEWSGVGWGVKRGVFSYSRLVGLGRDGEECLDW